MGSYKLITLKEVKTGKEFSISHAASAELLQRIKDGEVEIVGIETIRTPEFLSNIEIVLLQLHEEGKELPKELQPFLQTAIEKRKELLEYERFLKSPLKYKYVKGKE